MAAAMEPSRKYLSPYLAGVGVGLALLASIVLAGKGLGASGALMRTLTTAIQLVSPATVDANGLLAELGGGGKNPLDNYLVYMFVGVFFGGLISGILSGRFKKEINHGPRISPRTRILFAVFGGALFAIGSRLARGCTSGVALSGGATLSLGAWITMFTMFGAAFFFAFLFRKLWI